MIDEQTLRTLIESGGVGGTIVIVVWLLRGVFMKWLENIGVARKLDAERLTAERASEQALALALNGVTTELKLSRGMNEQMIDKFELLATRDQISRIHDDVKTIPGEVWRLGNPRLDTMKTGIEDRIAVLQASIEERLPEGAINARVAIQTEFGQMNARLDDIGKSLLQLTQPSKSNTKSPYSVAKYMGKQPKDIQEKP
jgi:hypothetical protein